MNIDFTKGDGLVPAIIQDSKTRNVLMLGYMNQEALDVTQATGKVTFYSRSKQRLWTKGETSGNYLILQEIEIDCDKDTLLIQASPVGPVCHTGQLTCFKDQNDPMPLAFLDALTHLISSRHQEMPKGSYTTKLFTKGINKIAQKVGEEAVEFIIEAKDDDDNLLLNEGADLLFHMMVLLEAKGHTLADITAILASRHK